MGGITSWQQLGEGCDLKIDLDAETAKIFAGRQNSLVWVTLSDGVERRVEVYETGTNLSLGSGWFVIMSVVRAKAGDVVLFKLDDESRIHVSFFNSNGFELLPTVEGKSTDPPQGKVRGKYGAAIVMYATRLLVDERRRKLVRQLTERKDGGAVYICKLNHTSTRKGMLYFKREFSSEFAPRGVTDVYIRMDGCSEFTKGKMSMGSDEVARVCKGWQSFVRKNGLTEGDIYALRLERTRDGVVLDVYLVS